MEKPKAFISNEKQTYLLLDQMINDHKDLYEKCISTPGFAYCFSQIVNRSVHFDFLFQNGIVPKNYLD